MMLPYDDDCISLRRLQIFAFGGSEAPCSWNEQVTDPGIIKISNGTAYRRGNHFRSTGSRVGNPREERSVKKGVIPTMRMLEMICACVAERVPALTTRW
jgi:hypothetical protein